MRLTPEDKLAELLRKLKDDVRDLGSTKTLVENPTQTRVVEETETSDDQIEQSVDEDPGWQWGTSEWGFDVWN